MFGYRGRPRILVIDPDGELEPLISEIVADSGCEVVCAKLHGLRHDTFSFPNPFALAVMTIAQRTSHPSADDSTREDALANVAYDLFPIPPDPKTFSKAIFEILGRYEKDTKSSREVNAA